MMGDQWQPAWPDEAARYGSKATVDEIRDLANQIAERAAAIDDGTLEGSVHVAARRLLDDARKLVVWTEEA